MLCQHDMLPRHVVVGISNEVLVALEHYDKQINLQIHMDKKVQESNNHYRMLLKCVCYLCYML